jgi:hypothetical protein
MSTFPRFYRVRQTFESPQLADRVAEVRKQLVKLHLEDKIGQGETSARARPSR